MSTGITVRMSSSRPTSRSTSPRLFGTDGIRDVAGQGLLAPDQLIRVGRALARFARQQSEGAGPARVLIAFDPRPSSPIIVDAISGAMAMEGVSVLGMGMVPTPALAFGVVEGEFDLGIMVSASHNPPEYNGIKPFLGSGRKLSRSEEEVIEGIAHDFGDDVAEGFESVAPPIDLKARRRYIERTAEWLGEAGRLDGLKVMVDLAAGAATSTAPDVLRKLGAEAVLLHPASTRPINKDCGSQHPEALSRALAERPDIHLGLAFDGDADRVLIGSGHEGQFLDGDDILALLAEDHFVRTGKGPDEVVGTVMCNLGLEERLESFGTRLARTPVGDRMVAERMRESGSPFGGEPSGHVVLHRADLGAPHGEPVLIGDALVGAVRVLQACKDLGIGLDEARARRPRYPQILVGVRVEEKVPLSEWPALTQKIAEEEERLAGTGRFVVRYSGTEPLLRIMAEGKEQARVEAAVAAVQAVAESGVR